MKNLTFSGTMQLGGIKGRKVDMEVTLRPAMPKIFTRSSGSGLHRMPNILLP